MSVSDLVGERIGRYRIDQRIGKGGTAEVFRAWDPLLKSHVAIKRILHDEAGDDEKRRQILGEGQILRKINHPSIAQVYDVLEEGGELFLVEELVTGESLREHVREPMSVDLFLEIAAQCLGALEAARERGIVHCDLKPENIVFTREGVPKILDFGLSRRLPVLGPDEATVPIEEALTRTVGRGITGTPSYMAPEMIRGGDVDTRSDLFSLGVIFYEMLTGTNPFRKASLAETMAGILKDDPAPPSQRNPSVPKALDGVVLSMLQKDPHHRPATPAAVREELDRAAGKVPRIGRVAPWLFAAAVLVIAFLAARNLLFPGRSPGLGGYLTVQPFESLSPDPEVGPLAAGFTEMVKARLTGLGGMHVVDPESELVTNVILEGAVQRSEDALRVSYRFVERATGRQLGAGEADGRVSDLFELQNRVTRGIAGVLTSKLDVEFTSDPDVDPPPPTPDGVVYELYVRACGHLEAYDDPANVDAAIDLLRRALQRDGTFAAAQAGLGEAWWRKWTITKDPEAMREAEEWARTAVTTAPDLAEAHVALGTVYRETGRTAEAQAELERARELEPRSDAALLGLANVLLARNLPDEAEKAYRDAIAARPDYWALHSYLGAFYYRRGRIDDAEKEFRRVVELTPDNARGWRNLGGIEHVAGRLGEAEKCYRKSIALLPSAQAVGNLATILKQQGRYEDAAEMYRRAAELDPNEKRVWGNLAALYELIPGREEEALAAWRRAIVIGESEARVNPADAGLLALLGMYYAGVGRYAEAREKAERALELAPGDVSVMHLALVTFHRAGDRDRAIELTRQALDAGLPAGVLKDDPSLAPLLEDPGFLEVLRQHDVEKD